jgi:uncharacterized membrane protein
MIPVRTRPDLAALPPDLADLKTSRIEALSDGVFAIAMTILVLNITVPTPPAVEAPRLSEALRRLMPQLFVYFVTFINLGVLWVGQHNQHHFIARADRWFIWINLTYLLLISLLPLSTALLGHYPLHPFALTIYGSNLIAATLALGLHWEYASRNGRLLHARVPSRVVRLGHRRVLGSASAYAFAMLLSLVEPTVTLGLFLVVPLVNVLPYSVDRHFRAEVEQ